MDFRWLNDFDFLATYLAKGRGDHGIQGGLISEGSVIRKGRGVKTGATGIADRRSLGTVREVSLFFTEVEVGFSAIVHDFRVETFS